MTALDRLRHVAESATPGTGLALSTSQRGELTALAEAFDRAELALEDAGWARMTGEAEAGFSPEGLRKASKVSRAMVVTNPLMRRGVALRTAYIWGAGVQVTARAAGKEGTGQDVNAVVQAFLDDEGNRANLTGEQAHEEMEKALATDGNLFISLVTKPRSGRTQARTIPWEEVVDVLHNPEDRTDIWFFKRVWTTTALNDAGRTVTTNRTDWYPALGFRPPSRPRSINGQEVHWDKPVLHVSVNRLAGWKFGIGDVYTAIPWSRAYADFLRDWSQLIKALSAFAFRATASSSKLNKTAAALRAHATGNGISPPLGAPSSAGATFVGDPGSTLEAVPKSGATIDSESGRPLAAMVATAFDVPVTMLLGDPGVTGARATAQTLDPPMRLAMTARRNRWSEVHRRVLGHVILEAVRAPAGPLRGTIIRDEDDGREILTLAQDTDATVETAWPPLEDETTAAKLAAVKIAADLSVLPPLHVARLALEALGEEDVDAILDEMTDDDGNFVDPTIGAAVDAIGRDRAAFAAGTDDPDAEEEETPPAVPARRPAAVEEAAPPAPPAPPITVNVAPPNIEIVVEGQKARTRRVTRNPDGSIAEIIETPTTPETKD